MGNLLLSINQSYLINSFDIRRQSSVDTKHFPVHDRTQRKIIENFNAKSVSVSIPVLLESLVMESVARNRKVK